MTLFEAAVKGRIPFVGVHYDDVVTFRDVLQSIAGRSVMPMPKTSQVPVGENSIYWTDDPELTLITVENHKRLVAGNTSCVVLNPSKPSLLIFDAGIMPTPAPFIEKLLKPFTKPETLPAMLQVLNGLSVRDCEIAVNLTMVMLGSITPQGIRKTRLMLGGMTPGLQNVDTEYDFYVMSSILQEYLEKNDQYFTSLTVPAKLVPRGLMLVGSPGVGKSLAASVIATRWKVPLFRLDVGSSMVRWVGESEGRFSRNLQMVDANAPCVLLIDEIEKLFGDTGGDGVSPMGRMSAQLLWWLQYRSGRVFTVMTSNDLTTVPPELYRPGRIDSVMEIPRLTLTEAKGFGYAAFENVLGKAPITSQSKAIRERLEGLNQGQIAHSDVVGLVVDLIKERGWA